MTQQKALEKVKASIVDYMTKQSKCTYRDAMEHIRANPLLIERAWVELELSGKFQAMHNNYFRINI